MLELLLLALCLIALLATNGASPGGGGCNGPRQAADVLKDLRHLHLPECRLRRQLVEVAVTILPARLYP